ncbi:MAG: SIR2 family protein [Rhodobacteraceae bacterium]|nr:SIR2 family protein [Paracoccaceae bacterium]
MNDIGIDKLAEHLKDIKSRGKQTVILIGAGISKTSGIPLAKEIAEEAQKESYIDYMKGLKLGERSSIFRKYNKEAKINSAHLFLAFLIENGFINNILTTNFDNLAIRSLSTQNIYPAVYDLSILNKEAAIKNIDIKPNSPAVYYLHGQVSTYPKNLKNELLGIKPSIKSLFERFSDCCWIVVGYSGNDPVFDCLCETKIFKENLYWVHYGAFEEKDSHLLALLKNRNDTFLIEDYDADSLFIDLRRELGLQFPNIIDKPFTSLLKTIEEIRITKSIKNPTKRVDLIKDIDLKLDYNPNQSLIKLAIDVFQNHKSIKTPELATKLKDEHVLVLINKAEWIGGYEDFEDIESIYNLKAYVLNKSKNKQLKKAYGNLLNGYGNWLWEKFESTNQVEYLEKVIEVFHTAFQSSQHPNYLSNLGILKAYLAEILDDIISSKNLYNEAFEVLCKASQLTDLDHPKICLAIAKTSYANRLLFAQSRTHAFSGINEALKLFEDIEASLELDLGHLSKDLSHIEYYSFLNYHWSEALLVKSKLSKSGKLLILEKAKQRCQMVIDKGDMDAKELLERINFEISKTN